MLLNNIRHHDKNNRHGCFRPFCSTNAKNSTEKGLAGFSHGLLFRYYPIYEISRSLGLQKSLALPVFHALTGCDTVSSFCREKQEKCMGYLECFFSEVTCAFVEITSAPSELSDECTEIIETFVVLLYDRGRPLIGHDSNCSVRVPVVWIEFLQPPQL